MINESSFPPLAPVQLSFEPGRDAVSGALAQRAGPGANPRGKTRFLASVVPRKQRVSCLRLLCLFPIEIHGFRADEIFSLRVEPIVVVATEGQTLGFRLYRSDTRSFNLIARASARLDGLRREALPQFSCTR